MIYFLNDSFKFTLHSVTSLSAKIMKPTTFQIININTDKEFNELALQVFLFQYDNCQVYKQYVDLLKINPQNITQYSTIPFLPIEFFKSHIITTNFQKPVHFFESSGTSGAKSKHYYSSLDIYEESFTRCFELFYGLPEKFAIMALLPSYSENPNSSLIYMVNALIGKSHNKLSGFNNDNLSLLKKVLSELKTKHTPTLLIGVTFALLDFCEKFNIDFPELTVVETGGMKGRRKEMIREELHDALKKGFNVCEIHSEYGMTELFSQAYSKGNGIFACPPWMKVLTRDVYDPLSLSENNNGALNIIDLANVNSCSFIATEDIGTVFQDGTFTVSGRMDSSHLRGCNLLVED